MRVTDLTKQNTTLRNMANNAERLQKLQDEMASGRRINRLSDDPLGATQAQDLRTKISFLTSLQRNIQNNFIWLDRTEVELEHVSTLLQQAKNLALAQANANADEATRAVSAAEMDAIGKSLVNAGNAKIGKVFIFSGSKTLTQPLRENEQVQPALVDTENVSPDIKFVLNLKPFEAEFRGFSSNAYKLRITSSGELGRARYVVSDDGGETWSQEKTLLPSIEVVNAEGKPSDKVQMVFSGPQQDDLGAPIDFPEGLVFSMEPNPRLGYHGNEDHRMVATGEGTRVRLNLTARDIFYRNEERPQSIDIIDVLTGVKRAMEENDASAVEMRLGDLDRAFEQVLHNRAEVGAVRRELEQRLQRLEERTFTSTAEMSEIEDLDFPAAVTEMNLADVRNKATLDTSGRLLQPSLLDFLR